MWTVLRISFLKGRYKTSITCNNNINGLSPVYKRKWYHGISSQDDANHLSHTLKIWHHIQKTSMVSKFLKSKCISIKLLHAELRNYFYLLFTGTVYSIKRHSVESHPKNQSWTMMKDLLSFVLVFLSTQNYIIERACQLISKIVKKGPNCPIY